jgi:hypothetical protein
MPIISGKAVWVIAPYAGSRMHGMEHRYYYLAWQYARLF